MKKQEQRLNDLKKTLQRELKVQSLPNDDPIDPKVAALTPPLPRKNSTSRSSDSHPKTRRMNSHERSPLPSESMPDSLDMSSNNSYGTQDYFVGQNNSHPGYRPGLDRSLFGASGSHATISVNDSVRSSPHGSYSVQQNRSRTSSVTNEFDTRHLEKDINFQYLKHVVMKFMLSREHEVSIYPHLIQLKFHLFVHVVLKLL